MIGPVGAIVANQPCGMHGGCAFEKGCPETDPQAIFASSAEALYRAVEGPDDRCLARERRLQAKITRSATGAT